MPTKFVITAENNQQIFQDVVSKGDAKTYQIDLSPWAEDNSNVSSVTWTVESGNAGVSGQALTSNVASALVTFSQEGRNLIKVAATTAAQKYVAYLDVTVKEPFLPADDYGIC